MPNVENAFNKRKRNHKYCDSILLRPLHLVRPPFSIFGICYVENRRPQFCTACARITDSIVAPSVSIGPTYTQSYIVKSGEGLCDVIVIMLSYNTTILIVDSLACLCVLNRLLSRIVKSKYNTELIYVPFIKPLYLIIIVKVIIVHIRTFILRAVRNSARFFHKRFQKYIITWNRCR